MSYGIELLNQYNERALDFDSAYRIHEYGNCVRWPTTPTGNFSNGPDALVMAPFGYGISSPVSDRGLIADFFSGNDALGRPINWVSVDDGSTVYRLPQFAAGGTTTYLYGFSGAVRSDVEVPHVIPDYDTEIFFKLPSEGLTYASTYLQKYDQFGTGVVGICQPYHTLSGAVKYLTARPSEPSSSAPETHGMQLFDSSGAKVFDSRYEVVGIKDYIFISESDIRDVLINGATKTYNLRQNVSNPYISSGDFTSLTWDSRPIYEMLSLPRMRLLNGNQLVIDRVRYENAQGGAGYFFDGSAAATILIAEVNEP